MIGGFQDPEKPVRLLFEDGNRNIKKKVLFF